MAYGEPTSPPQPQYVVERWAAEIVELVSRAEIEELNNKPFGRLDGEQVAAKSLTLALSEVGLMDDNLNDFARDPSSGRIEGHTNPSGEPVRLGQADAELRVEEIVSHVKYAMEDELRDELWQQEITDAKNRLGRELTDTELDGLEDSILQEAPTPSVDGLATRAMSYGLAEAGLMDDTLNEHIDNEGPRLDDNRAMLDGSIQIGENAQVWQEATSGDHVPSPQAVVMPPRTTSTATKTGGGLCGQQTQSGRPCSKPVAAGKTACHLHT